MNKRGFIDLEDLNPMAVMMAVIVGIVVFGMMTYASRAGTDIGKFWIVISPIVSGLISFFVFQFQLNR